MIQTDIRVSGTWGLTALRVRCGEKEGGALGPGYKQGKGEWGQSDIEGSGRQVWGQLVIRENCLTLPFSKFEERRSLRGESGTRRKPAGKPEPQV